MAHTGRQVSLSTTCVFAELSLWQLEQSLFYHGTIMHCSARIRRQSKTMLHLPFACFQPCDSAACLASLA